MTHLATFLTNFHPHVGGVERHVEELLGRLVHRGYRCTVISLDNEAPRREVWRGIEILRLRRLTDVGNVFALPSTGEWRRVVTHLQGQNIDVVATHTRFFVTSALGVWFARRAGLPSVHTEHGGGYVVSGSPLVTAASRAVDYTYGRQVLQRADKLFCISGASSRFVAGLAHRRGDVLGNGTDIAYWSSPASWPPDVPQPDGRRVLAYVGRLVAEKGWQQLVDAVALLPATIKAQLLVLIAGDGPDRERLADRVSELGLAAIVHPVGPRGSDDIRAMLSGNVYVNPSWAAEGFQTTLLEAAASGAWIITSDVGGARETVLPGETGEVLSACEPSSLANAIVRSLVSRPQPGAATRLVASYDWSAVTSRYAAALDELVSSRSG